MSFKSYLHELWEKVGSGENKTRNIFMLLLFFLGIILMFGGSIFVPQQEGTEKQLKPGNEYTSSLKEVNRYEEKIKHSLQDVLEHVEGISDVQVFIKVTEGKKSIYARDKEQNVDETLEQDTEGGTREIYESSVREEYVMVSEGGGESPLLKKEKMPEIRGVLVVARGLNNTRLRYEVKKAVRGALEVPLYRISALPLGED